MGFELVRARARRVRSVGVAGVTQRLAQKAYQRTSAADLRFNLAFDDILADIPSALPTPAVRPSRSNSLTIGWVCTPPAPGSGGHTTLFRMVEALEARGHSCVLYLYDKHGLDTEASAGVIRRNWPRVRAKVADVTEGIVGVDAVIASGWESAHLIVKYATEPVRRLYFMQDYEPYFYAHGAEHELAAMTYRLPFRRIALGEMLDGMVHSATGLDSDVVPFGCDSSAYGPPPVGTRRHGIVFFCRPEFPRRGYELAALALALFHKRCPEQEIHIYGAPPRGLPIDYTFHGRLSTDDLNALYGRTIAGLAMSFTNITLVAEEMLAAGNIPVLNDMSLARRVLPNPFVKWAAPTAAAIADALVAAVSETDIDTVAAKAAQSVTGRSWVPTQEAVVRIVEQEVYG